MKKALIILVSILSVVIIVLSVVLYNTTNTLTSTSASLEGVYQRSLYDLVDNVNNMEVDVSKLMVTNDSSSQQKILSSLKQRSSDAENDLSLLPINASLIEKTTSFINHMNGYCSSLITYKEGKLDESDYNTLANVYTGIASIKKELNSIMEKVMSGYRISDNIDKEDLLGDFSASFNNLSSDTIEYPSLIYDGPFSDSTDKKIIKGLSDVEITETDAEKLITDLFKDNITNLNFLGTTEGKFVTYDFGLNTKDNRNYFLQITKQGGFLLTMSSNEIVAEEIGTEEISTEDNMQDIDKTEKQTNESLKIDNAENTSTKTKNAQSVAIDFAEKLNLSNMQCVWSASSNDICYVNLAPVIDDIIMYPDLIKAKIDLNSDKVIGWEATSYAYNHAERDDLIPQLSEEEAKNLVSKNLDVESQKLCVIPLDYVGETLAYEFAGKYDNFNYYLYIDAYTGNQVRVLRVIQTEQGELVI